MKSARFSPTRCSVFSKSVLQFVGRFCSKFLLQQFLWVSALTGIAAPGDIDPSFEVSLNEYPWGISLLPDGKMLLGVDRSLLMLKPNGEADLNFNLSADNVFLASSVRWDDSLFLGGSFTVLNNRWHRRIAVISERGILDETFQSGSEGGISNSDGSGGNFAHVYATGIQRDGRILIGGQFTHVAGLPRSYFARLEPNGDVDKQFDPGPNAWVWTTSVQADGKIILGGAFSALSGSRRTAIARLHEDGSVDSSFNAKLNDRSIVGTTVIQPDGRIVIAGSFTNVGGVSQQRLARLNSDGSLDASFHAQVDAAVSTIGLQTDGRILVGGFISEVNGAQRRGIARLNTNGTLDEEFNPRLGFVNAPAVLGIALEQYGTVVISGYFDHVGDVARRNIARLNNGFVDERLFLQTQDRILLIRRGCLPEAQDVAFSLSLDGGKSWSDLGWGSRITDGWELRGLLLPPAGTIRARGRIVSGTHNGSSGIFEKQAAFDFSKLVLIRSAALERNGTFRTTFTGAPKERYDVLTSSTIDAPPEGWKLSEPV